MFIKNEFRDGVATAKLSRKDTSKTSQDGGGATIAKTKKTLLVGTWNKSILMSNGRNQN